MCRRGEVSKAGSRGPRLGGVRKEVIKGRHTPAFLFKTFVLVNVGRIAGEKVRTGCQETISTAGGWSELRKRCCPWREGGLNSTLGLMAWG